MSLNEKLSNLHKQACEFSMSLNEKLSNLHKQVCELRESINAPKTDNALSHNVLSLKGACENSILDINKSCSYLNKSTKETVRESASANAIAVGKESVPLIASLKKLAVDVYKSDSIDVSASDIQKQIQNTLSMSEDNLHRLEDQCKANEKFIQNMEFLIKHFKNQNNSDESDSETEISSFLHKDIVTSSPIKFDPNGK